MPVKRIAAVFGFLFVLALGSVFAVIAFRRPPPRPAVAALFVGFTNDTTGARVALFAISNASPSAVVRGSHYTVQHSAGDRWTDLTEGWLPGRALRSASSELVAVAPPTNQAVWRAAFSVRMDEGILFGAATELLLEAQKEGLPTHYRRQSFSIGSDPIQTTP